MKNNMKDYEVFIIFYKKEGRWQDRLIRWKTKSKYSHCEIVVAEKEKVNDVETTIYKCFTSSSRSGGVILRPRKYLYATTWDIVEVNNINKQDIVDHFRRTKNDKYDWLNILVGQIMGFSFNAKSRWICSEWVAALYGLTEPYNINPGELYNEIIKRK